MSSTTTNTSAVGSTETPGDRPEHEPPAVFARQVDDGRRRELARALHTPQPRAAGIALRLDRMRVLLARYRAEAISLHARLVELELAGNDNIAPLRRALIESSVQIENIGRMLAGAPMPEWSHGRDRLARGTEPLVIEDEWGDQPTLTASRSTRR